MLKDETESELIDTNIDNNIIKNYKILQNTQWKTKNKKIF